MLDTSLINNKACEVKENFAGRDADTSSLFNALRYEYQKKHIPVSVDFRELVGWVRLGDQHTHQIHPYPAKLLPHIAHFFSRLRSVDGPKIDRVLDPFSGSGTVALEASIAGLESFIADANPLALLISKVKTTPFDTGRLVQNLDSILARYSRLKTAPKIQIVNEDLWYAPPTKVKLEILLRCINETETDQNYRNFFHVCFSVVARKASLADPSISVPVRLKERPSFSAERNAKIKARLEWAASPNIAAEFEKNCLSNIDRIKACNDNCPRRKASICVGNDARHLLSPQSSKPLDTESVPMIITSPPYGSAQKYVRSSSLSLNWLGLANPGQLSYLESHSIGREHVSAFRNKSVSWDLPEEFMDLINEIEQINALRAEITRRYLHEMQEAIAEMARVITRGGRIVIVIGNNHVCGKPLRNDRFISQILHNHGFSLELALLDDIKSHGLMTKRNKTASIISRESVLVFKK